MLEEAHVTYKPFGQRAVGRDVGFETGCFEGLAVTKSGPRRKEKFGDFRN
jgi:hypothetical protein